MTLEHPELNTLTERIIGAAIEVHRHLGPGLLESAYEQCLVYELEQLGLLVQRQAVLPVVYKGIELTQAYRIDILVGNKVVVEVKAVEALSLIHISSGAPDWSG